MAKDTLAVYEPSHVYIERFLGYVHAKNGLSVETAGFTDLNILREYLKDHKIKAVLFSLPDTKRENEREESFIMELSGDPEIVLMVLGEQAAARSWIDGLLGEASERIGIIEKYQSAENIISEAVSFIKENRKEQELPFRGNYILAGIYSPADKVSHPKMAAALLKRLRKESGKEYGAAMYINLEPFSGMEMLMEQKGEGDISDVIYYFKTNPGKLDSAVRKVRGQYCGMSVLPAAVNVDDLNELNEEGWPAFFSAIANCCGISIILVDVMSFNLKMMSVICKHGNLYIPALPCERDETERSRLDHRAREESEKMRLARYKMQEFRKYLEENNHTEILDKILELRV